MSLRFRSLFAPVIAILLCHSISAVAAHAEDKRSFTKVDADTITVTITTEEKQNVQASSYTDDRDDERFLKMLLGDPGSRLSKLRTEIELENCQTTSTKDQRVIPDCGGVTWHGPVVTSYGRGGWEGAGESRTYFLVFEFVGSGQFLETYYVFTIDGWVSADVDAKDKYKGSMTKTLSLGNISRFQP